MIKYQDTIPFPIITGTCVGGELILIIGLVCVIAVVLSRKKLATQQNQLQEQELQLQQQQTRPQERQREAHQKQMDTEKLGYLNDHMAPTGGNPRGDGTAGGEYLNNHMAPTDGNPRGDGTTEVECLNDHMVPKY